MPTQITLIRVVLLGVALAMCLVALPLQSSFALMRKMELKELKERAHTIVRGRVLKKQSQWNEGNNFIWTFVDIKVSDWIKDKEGKQEEVITVKIPGGTVGDISQHSSDEIVLNEDEEVILFLGKERYQDKEYYTVPDLEQGKLSIKEGKIEHPDIPAEDILNELRRGEQ